MTEGGSYARRARSRAHIDRHPCSYSHLLQSLEVEGLADKIRVLKSFDTPAFDIKRLNLKTVRFEGMFETKKLVSYAQQSAAAFATPKKPSPSPAPGQLATPAPGTAKKVAQMAAQQTSTAAKIALGGTPGTVKAVKKDGKENDFTEVVTSKPRLIDPKKALSKQNPPPCNAHYLGTCTKGANCTYEHNYRLSPKQLSLLRVDAKKSPCIVRYRFRRVFELELTYYTIAECPQRQAVRTQLHRKSMIVQVPFGASKLTSNSSRAVTNVPGEPSAAMVTLVALKPRECTPTRVPPNGRPTRAPLRRRIIRPMRSEMSKSGSATRPLKKCI